MTPVYLPGLGNGIQNKTPFGWQQVHPDFQMDTIIVSRTFFEKDSSTSLPFGAVSSADFAALNLFLGAGGDLFCPCIPICIRFPADFFFQRAQKGS